jgi:hypothetical protein
MHKKANDLHLAAYNNKKMPTNSTRYDEIIIIYIRNLFESLAQICRSA